VSAASAAHEFLLNPEIDLSAARRPVAYQDRAAEYVDPLTAATRLEFGNTDFDFTAGAASDSAAKGKPSITFATKSAIRRHMQCNKSW
jgi:hypothetical protein